MAGLDSSSSERKHLCYSSVLKQETETLPAALSVTILSDFFGSGIIGRQRFSAAAIHYHYLLTIAHCSIRTNVLEEADASIFVGVQIQLGAKLAVRFIRAACQNPPCPRHRSISVTVQNRESDIHIFKHNPTLIHPHALSINFKP